MSILDGFFKLDNWENMGDDDLVTRNIDESVEENLGESSEFDNNSYAKSGVDASKEVSIPVPGGDKETPGAKPYDETSIPVPGGDSEKPKANLTGGTTITIPGAITLTDMTYNSAINTLHQSLKEAVDVLEMMQSANVVPDLDGHQKEFLESLVDQAIEKAYDYGPMFEAVSRSDKEEVRDITLQMRPIVAREVPKMKLGKYYKPALIGRIMWGLFMPLDLGNLYAGLMQVWKNRLWQVVGMLCCGAGNAGPICQNISERHRDILTDKYKLCYVPAPANFIDLFRVHFNWKNDYRPFFLIIDREIPKELKTWAKDLAKVPTDVKKEDGKSAKISDN